MNTEKLISDLSLSQYDLDRILQPNWNGVGIVHNWRNYVDDVFKEHWDDLSLETKIAVYYYAEGEASREEWP